MIHSIGLPLKLTPHKKETADLNLIVSGLKVEHSGLEPLTSTLPVLRSSQMS